jgi:hypothetical protein
MTHFQNDILGCSVETKCDDGSDVLYLLHDGGNATEFHISKKHICGHADSLTESLRNELRRYGVRFKSYPENGKYTQC